MGLFDNEKVDIDNWPAVPEVSPCVSYLVNDMLELDRLLTNINSELSSYTGLGNFYSSVQGKVLTFQEKANYLAQSGWMVSDIKDEIEDPFRQRISGAADEICSVDAAQFTTENTIGLKGYVTTTVNDGTTSRTSKSTIVLDSLNLTDFLGADRESMTTVSYSGGGVTCTTTTTTLRDSDSHFSGLFRESYDKYIEQARWNNGMISHMPDGAPELHYMETMSYEEYLSALVPKDREYDRYAGAWNEMLAESFDAFLGLGLIYKAVTGEEAFTGDKLTQNEREESAASGAFALTVSVLTSAIGGTGWSGFATMLLADAAGGVVGVVTYEGLTNMGLSDSEAFLMSFIAGVVTGNGIERMAYSSPTYIDDLAKRMGKSPDEVNGIIRRLGDVAGQRGYSSVDDLLRHIDDLPAGVYDDIIDMLDKPLGSFDLDKVDDLFNNRQAYEVVESGTGNKFQEVFDLADNYTLSDDTFNNHILDRHGPNSTYRNKSHFNADFNIIDGIDSTLIGDNFVVGPNTAGRKGYIFEQTFTNPIGKTSKGKPLYTLKVVVDETGNVITAFPKK